MGPIVVDPSAIAGSFFDDEDPTFADAVMDRVGDTGGFAISLFWYECRNFLLAGERRGRTSAERLDEMVPALRLAGFTPTLEPGDQEVAALARQYSLSGYDASYAAIAIREKVPLATLDKKLIAAGAAGAFELWQPADETPA